MTLGGSGLARLDKLQLSPGPLGRSGLSGPSGLAIPIVPEFANVEVLAGFNGADAATAFTEESTNAAVATFSGQAQLDTAFKKFGTASLLLDGVGDFITFPDLAAYSLGANDFTIEAFVRFASLPNASSNGLSMGSHYLNTGNQRSWFFDFDTSDELHFSWSVDGIAGQNFTASNTPSLSTGIFYHVAVTRVGAVLRLFFEGTLLVASGDSISGDTLRNSTTVLRVGSIGSAGFERFFDGHIDEHRIVVGQGIYTESFAVPNAEFPRS